MRTRRSPAEAAALQTVQNVVNASLITTAKLAVNPVNPVTS